MDEDPQTNIDEGETDDQDEVISPSVDAKQTKTVVIIVVVALILLGLIVAFCVYKFFQTTRDPKEDFSSIPNDSQRDVKKDAAVSSLAAANSPAGPTNTTGIEPERRQTQARKATTATANTAEAPDIEMAVQESQPI